jgi:acyl dehydratase
VSANVTSSADTAPVEARFAVTDSITDALVAEARSYVGVPLRLSQWNSEASIDNIRHYALGLGDLNPLWTDEAYARESVHRTIVAPPTFLYSVYCGLAPGMDGLPALLREAKWRFYDWVRLGDQLRAEAQVDDVEVRLNRRGEKRILQFGHLAYYRVDRFGWRELVARCDQVVTRPPGPAREGAVAYGGREPYVYTNQELTEIEAAVLAVKPQGHAPRWWDDVEVGDKLQTIVKGPFTRMSMVCYYAGAPGSPGYRAFDAWWLNRHRALNSPGELPNTFPPAYFAGTGVSSMGHHDSRAARMIGMPGIYDNGNQRIGLMSTALTTWMGDAGRLYEYEHVIRKPVILGDTVYIDGTVTEKLEGEVLSLRSEDGPAAQVRIELCARNQLGDTVSTGEAAVLLPKRCLDADPAQGGPEVNAGEA